MKVHNTILLASGALILFMVGLSLTLRRMKNEDINRCSNDNGHGVTSSSNRKEETGKRGAVLPEHITDKSSANEDGSISGHTSISENIEKASPISALTNVPPEDTGRIVRSPVAQQLSSLSFSYALESVDSLKNAGMRDRLRHNLDVAKKAKEELGALEKDVQAGKIRKKLVHGRWLAVVEIMITKRRSYSIIRQMVQYGRTQNTCMQKVITTMNCMSRAINLSFTSVGALSHVLDAICKKCLSFIRTDG